MLQTFKVLPANFLPYNDIIYSIVGACLFSFYLAHHTKLIVSGKHAKYQMNEKDYVFGAMTLYNDIINMVCPKFSYGLADSTLLLCSSELFVLRHVPLLSNTPPSVYLHLADHWRGPREIIAYGISNIRAIELSRLALILDCRMNTLFHSVLTANGRTAN